MKLSPEQIAKACKLGECKLGHGTTLHQSQPCCRRLSRHRFGGFVRVGFSDPQFIYVDLESVTHIEQIDIIWETAYASEYKMQISDNAIDWTTIEHITNGDGGLDRILTSSEGRYVRMYGIQRGTEWGYSIFEFEIYELRITDVSNG